MPPAVVIRKGKQGKGLSLIEAGEALCATTVATSSFDTLDKKAEVEEILANRGELPLVVISFEDLEQTQVNEINKNSPLNRDEVS